MINNRSLIKITKSLPRMVSRLRWLLFDGIKQKPSASMDIVIADLLKMADALLTC
jgi:hypothetical protein